MIELFEHQLDMVSAMQQKSKGILQAPTGTGKTFTQAEKASEFLVDGFKVVVVSTPRIALSNQVAEEFIKYFGEGKNLSPSSYNAILIHSGESADLVEDSMTLEEKKEFLSKFKSVIPSTSFTSEFVERVNLSRDQKKPLIVFTTYHSTKQKVTEVLNSLGVTVSLHLNDEAQYLTQEGFSNILQDFEPENQYFFTATPKVGESEDGRGMNNSSLFGETIYKLSHREAVDTGLILDVDVDFIESNSEDTVSQEVLDANVGQVIQEAFYNTEEKYPGIGAKMLVATKGSNQIRNFLDSLEFIELLEEGVEILTVHSTVEVMTYNGSPITRKQFNKFKNKFGKDPDSRLIIIHYDILSEGIDIPGLLSVLILRKMQVAKFMQTVGRVVRLYRLNPELKKKGLVMFPAINDLDMLVSFKDMIRTLIKSYGYPEELISEQLTKGLPEDDEESLLEVETALTASLLDLMLEINSLQFEENYSF
jgi:superfamily II DNA or RNA helicase